jgi:hypothetical protein
MEDQHGSSQGYYEFEVCVGGDFMVVEENRNGWVHTNTNFYSFTAASGVDHTGLDFLNFECFYVSGYKYDDKIGNGVWDAGDTGISGWTITLEKSTDGGSTWTTVDTTTTDSTGYYEFYICEGGLYKVTEEDRSGWMATSPAYFEFNAVSGQDRTYSFFNFAFGMICGTKWYDLNQNGAQDSDEDPVEGIRIELYRNGVLIETTYTDSNGGYCFGYLGPGYYEVVEVMPNDPDDNQEWSPTYPSGGVWGFNLLSGSNPQKDFGNVVYYTAGLSWGYWKTHTEPGPAPRDDTYDMLPDYPMEVDIETPDGDYWVDDDEDADYIYGGGDDGPANGEGDGRSLFRAQLLALHMNLLKYPDMADALYFYPGDSYDGWTVQEVYDEALSLLNDGNPHDFHDLLDVLDRMNNNSHDNVLVIEGPVTPTY